MITYYGEELAEPSLSPAPSPARANGARARSRRGKRVPHRQAPMGADRGQSFLVRAARRSSRNRAPETLHPPRYRLVAASPARAGGPDDASGPQRPRQHTEAATSHRTGALGKATARAYIFPTLGRGRVIIDGGGTSTWRVASPAPRRNPTTTLGGTAFGRGTSITNGGFNTNLAAGKVFSGGSAGRHPRWHRGTPWPERRGRRCGQGTPLSASQRVFTAPGLAVAAHNDVRPDAQ
jgi:hypothetical protein